MFLSRQALSAEENRIEEGQLACLNGHGVDFTLSYVRKFVWVLGGLPGLMNGEAEIRFQDLSNLLLSLPLGFEYPKTWIPKAIYHFQKPVFLR